MTVHFSVLNLVCERGTICQLKVFDKGTSSVKNGILKGEVLDLGAGPSLRKLFVERPFP